MSKIYYLNKEKEWVEIPIKSADKSIVQTFPQTYTFGIDEAEDCGEISFFAPEKYHIPIDSIIKTVFGDKIKYWIVKNSKASKMAHPNIWTQEKENINTLTLAEPIEILRGFKIEPSSFAENSYTLSQILYRLFDIAKFNGEIDIPSIEYSNPKLTYVSTTLYLVSFELARTIDCLPYLDFNEDNKKWILKFQRLDGLNGLECDMSVFDNPVDLKDEIGEGLAKNVYCEVKNMLAKNIGLEPNRGSKKGTSSDESGKITESNFAFKTLNTINKLDKLLIYGQYNGVKDNEYIWTLENEKNIIYQAEYILSSPIPGGGEQKIQTISKNIKFLEENEYQLLTNNEKENKDNIYIHYKDNVIYLDNLIKMFSFGEPYSRTIFLKNETPSDFISNNVGDNRKFFRGMLEAAAIDHPYLTQAEFRAKYENLITRTIPFEAYNNSKYDDTTYFNQNAQQVDPDRIGRVLQTYIDNMQSGSLMKNGTTDSWDKIPMPGSIVKDDNKRYVLNSITVQENAHYITFDAQLTEERAKRREYIEANTELQINSIPNENLIDKLSFNSKIINFSLINEAIKPYPTDTFDLKYFINVQKPLYFAAIHNNFITNDGNYELEGDLLISRISNSIIFNEKADSNVIWTETVDDKGNIIPLNYTDRKGYIDVVTINLRDEQDRYMFDYTFEETPAKDPYEIFSFTFQVNYRGIGDTIVREDYVEYLLNGVENPTYSIRLFGTNIGRYDALPSEFVAEIASVSVSNYDSDTQSISVDFTSVEADYKSIVLLLNGKAIMIKNYYTPQNSLSSFKIYVSSEDGTPVRDGVLGIDPYEESK